jgi:hypothetical protein
LSHAVLVPLQVSETVHDESDPPDGRPVSVKLNLMADKKLNQRGLNKCELETQAACRVDRQIPVRTSETARPDDERDKVEYT